MIGIYKITNNKNGMSYIGQSVHCGKRFDEHYKGDQLIDKVIQAEGIENFKLEILQQVHQCDLSIWEDYYIMKYDTMYPNGYNKRWNCSEKTREMFLGLDKQQEDIVKTPHCNYTQNEMLFHMAEIIQQEENKENRILNQTQLNDFYKAQKKESESRPKILNVYNKDNLKGVTAAARRRAGQIEEMIQKYNNGVSTWDIQGMDELKCKEDYDDIMAEGVNYFHKHYGYIPDFGMPRTIKKDLFEKKSFSHDGIIQFMDFQTEPIFNTYRSLFKVGYFNPEKVWFLDRDDNKLDINQKYVWKKYGYLRLIITP